jgi:hypothetical protein
MTDLVDRGQEADHQHPLLQFLLLLLEDAHEQHAHLESR